MTKLMLKPCPFCGERDRIIIRVFKYDGKTPKYGVRCFDCGAEFRPYFSKQKAIELWNRRAV